MKPFRLMLLMLLLGTFVCEAAAATNADYMGVPPYVTSAVTPNVLLLLDNSGSMNARANCEIYNPVVLISCPSTSWDPTVVQRGMFDALSCFTYDPSNSRFVAATVKASLSATCLSTQWDGNLLNWIATRRIDVVKQALIGGQCATAPLVDGTCPPIGTPPLVTITGETASGAGAWPGLEVSAFISQAQATGRVPSAVRTAGTAPNPLYFVVGLPTYPQFCVNSSENFASCPAAGAFHASSFSIQVGMSTAPTGVIQDLANKMRWALMVFNYPAPGGSILTPMGSRQAFNAQTGVWTTWPSNTVAMIQGIQAERPRTATPLAESLYEATRYFAQLPSAENPGYVYPIAFSPAGGSFKDASFGPGSLAGPAEITALSGSETCPAGYIANACGRDPFFFGSNHTPSWASPSTVVPCCKNFILILTDGFPQADFNIPAALQSYANSAPGDNSGHQGFCTGPNLFTACAPFPPPFQAHGHKTDYLTNGNHYIDDVALWAHTTDLRPDNGNSDPTKACNSTYGAIPRIPVINEVGHCLPGNQTPTIYTFFASFGISVGKEPLMQTAKQGGFIDQNGNKKPDLTSEWDAVNNYTGAPGPDGLPDTYFESSNANDLKDKLQSAITSILQRVASGSSVSILSNSSTGVGAVYQAYFFPASFNNTLGATVTEVDWTGYLQGLFVDQYGNLREDYSATGCTGPPDGKLVLKHDCIVKIRYDTVSSTVFVDRFQDLNGDGIADTVTPYQTVTLANLQPVWEAGRRLALTNPDVTCPANTGGVTCRRILTWLDISNGGGVGPSVEEYNEFAPARVGFICPYLGGALAIDCNSSNATNKTNALNEATNIINWVRGLEIAGLRSRMLPVIDDTGNAVTKVWSLGDIMSSSPVEVGAPSERYDVVYGDSGYSTFYQRYRDRRKVIYAGGNDGMLHAFSGGFFTSGDDASTPGVVESARFTTVPMQPNTSTACGQLPCGGGVPQYSYRTNNPKLGAELWAFIPQDLLPQLRWLTMTAYSHMYYVDLTPKVTDVRIFANDADHPGGWGTILIGGFRLGGSCTNCTQGTAGPRVVNADFNYNGNTTDVGNAGTGSDTRVFLSSYFVLDVTNPEKDPVLLWVFRDKDLGLTTAAPAVLRVSPLTDASTSSANEKWYVVFGTGPTNLDGSSGQTAKMFVVDLKQGPTFTAINQTSGTVGGTACSLTSPCIVADTASGNNAVRAFSGGEAGASMGNAITVDYPLNFRVAVIYAGVAACNASPGSPCGATGPQWRGAVYRLTTNNGNPDPNTWGLSGAPTKLISNFTYSTPQASTCASTSPCKVGPMITAPAVTIDDAQNLWVYFGTGRFYSTMDKTNQDMQHLFGVKDCIIGGTCTDQTVERNNLLNVSSVVVCTVCSGNQVTGVTGVTSLNGSTGSALVGLVNSMDGWFTTLPTPGERSLAKPVILGGNVFFTSFVPTNDICVASGQGYLYALFYLTGSAYTDPTIGTTPSGANVISNRDVSLGSGVPSQIALQIGAQGTGAPGGGSLGKVTGFIQSSSGVLGQLAIKTALSPWSRILAWRDM